MNIPVEALIIFAFVSGACIFGFLAHVITGFLYERLIKEEYVHVDLKKKNYYPVEELLKK